ncbi:hypothetical protein C7999DRAFT_32252 [Corynascus novoguineensis]|uniref:Carboxylesterase type B domain-containing protein n=1 Tax=Corynascus novoguineensis TaxID=1126955 RepID=A0AAN7HIU4_9PEZI|nr:hypothetical protein C7999DRAFT_32252 [Corynascus novoguineensis]
MGLFGRFPILAVALAACTFDIAAGSYGSGDLTILASTDLTGSPNDGSGAIIVGKQSAFDTGRAACALLGEEPWSPEMAEFSSVLNTALGYQEYQHIAPKNQLYWVSKTEPSRRTCRAIDARGRAHDVDCRKKLPILCTHNAPVSSSTSDNNTATWQVQQTVGNKVLTGYRDYHVWKFRGIRFAETPERFTYSRVASFDDEGEVDATTAGVDCSQPGGNAENGSSEDCLFANVWTPYLPPKGSENKKSKLKPVMLYLYGGGFVTGSGKSTITDGTNLAARGDVVVVTVNYRLGSIGFLNLNDGVHNGNYGISDMVTALEWVHKYIKYFGGDPDNVTLFGESAGAESTHILLGVEKANGLFHRAAMQSSPDGWPGPNTARVVSLPYYDTLEHNYEITTTKVLSQAGCLNATNKVACLDKLSGFELVNLPLNANGIVRDGTYLTNPGLVVNSTAGSLATDVTVMLGLNRDETGVFIGEDALPAANQTFLDYFDQRAVAAFGVASGTSASALLGMGPDRPLRGLPPSLFDGSGAATPDEILAATVHLSTAWLFGCNAYAKAYSAARHGAFRRTYAFQFNRTYSPRGYTQPWCDPFAVPAGTRRSSSFSSGEDHGDYFRCHAGEQVYVFGSALRAGMPDRDGSDVPTMRLVVDHWAAFARWGDPNPRPGWLRARGHEDTLRELERTGRWEAVDARRPTMRVLQWGGEKGQVPLGEGMEELCEGLGAGLDSLEA